MATLRSAVLPLNDYPNGSRTVGPVNVPDGVTVCDIEVAYQTVAEPDIWPDPATTLEVIPEVSLDGEQTWREAGAFSTNGGPHLDKFGNELAWSRGGGSLPAGTNRRYRVRITIAGGPLRTRANVVTE